MPTQRDERIEAADDAFEARPVEYGSDIGEYAHDKFVYREGYEAGYLAASSAQCPVDAKDSEGLWERFQALLVNDAWTCAETDKLTDVRARALSRLVQEAVEAERERIIRLIGPMYVGNSPGPLMDAGFNHAKECIARAIRARREGEGEDG